MFYEKFSQSLLSETREETSLDFSSCRQSVLTERMLVRDKPSPSAVTSPSPRRRSAKDKEFAVRGLAQLISKSLRVLENPFQILMCQFRTLFLKEYRQRLRQLNVQCRDADSDSSSNNSKASGAGGRVVERASEAEKVGKEALVNIEYFMTSMVYSISLFYKPVVGEERMVLLRELIVNAVLNCLIRDDLYNLLFVILKTQYRNEERSISQKYDQMREITPQSLGISEYLCLNTSSPLMKISKEAAAHPSSPIHPAEEAKLRSPMIINSSVNPQASVLAPEVSLQERLKSPPYREAIEWLRTIAHTATPLKKLKRIAQVNDVICQCVDEFWQGTHVNPDRLRIDADQYISIMIYIIIKARVPDLFTNIALAGELAALGAKSKYNAYCLTTMQACFYHILSTENGKSASTATKDSSPVCQTDLKAKTPQKVENHNKYLSVVSSMQQQQKPRSSLRRSSC